MCLRGSTEQTLRLPHHPHQRDRLDVGFIPLKRIQYVLDRHRAGTSLGGELLLVWDSGGYESTATLRLILQIGVLRDHHLNTSVKLESVGALINGLMYRYLHLVLILNR